MLACDNCYLIPNATLRGHCCKTNLPSNTGFRGFGAPQGMLVMETLMSHVASHLGLAPEKVCCDLDFFFFSFFFFFFFFFFLGVPGFFLGREVLLRLFFFLQRLVVFFAPDVCLEHFSCGASGFFLDFFVQVCL